ncbi:histidine kinase [uncultured Croceitalea sp.]|uniref:sensor histidine kinase n=1 Tax=uncultured Croceitalea sp. TaxID=1798908 RepID=UPI0033068565
MESQNTYQKFKRLEPWLHLFLWVMVLFYPYLKYSEREGGYMMSFAHELNSLFFKMTISYFLYFYIFPKKDKKTYILVAILALVVNTALYELADGYFHVDHTYFLQHFMANLLTYLSFAVVFFTLYSVKNMYRQQMQLDALAQGKKQAEMNALKAQINPHFLFNTLNTIYANALKKDDNTPTLILKLSDGFRYLFHEGQQDYVSVEQEVQHLVDYIQLQQERLADKVVVHFSTEIDSAEKQIAPLLLIPFVENAFKYTSVLKGKKHPINITVALSDGHFLFSCVNPFDSNAKEAIDPNWSESGIGIVNVKERLHLLYDESHDLRIAEQDQNFYVNLSLEL